MTADREAIQRLQIEKLNAENALPLLREKNAFYRPKLEGLPSPVDSLESFFQLPFTTKDELVADQAENPPGGTNLTFPIDSYSRIHSTSGTTGRRLKCFDTRESWSWFVHGWELIYRAIGVTAEDRIFAAFGFGPFIGFWAGFEAAREIGAMAIPSGSQTSLQRLEWLADSRATVLLSTPTYALRLAEVARDNGIDLTKSSIRLTLHAGEPGASIPATRARIQEAWGARCWDHAGLSEVGPWGYECPDEAGMHVLESEFIAEVLELGGDRPVAEGEMGELVLTNLGRWAMPALRYRTGDLVRWTSAPCSCGTAYVCFPGGVLGRADDMIQVRGVNIYPAAVETIIREQPAVVEFEVEVFRQREMWEMRVRLELEAATDRDSVVTPLSKEMETRLGLRSEIEVVAPGSLPRYELKAKRFRLRRDG